MSKTLSAVAAALCAVLASSGAVFVAAPATASTPCFYSSAQTISHDEFNQLQSGATTLAEARAIIGSAGTGPKIERPVQSTTRAWQLCSKYGLFTIKFGREAGRGIVVEDLQPFIGR